MLNEIDLIKRLQAADENALEELIGEFEPRLFRAAKVLTGHEAEAEELVCDTFSDAFLGIKRFRKESGLFSWLYGILLNKFYYRLRQRRRETRFENASQVIINQDSNQIAVKFGQGDLTDWLGYVSYQHREVILLRYLEGLKIKEIARALQISENNVKVRLHRALNSLRKILEDGNLLPG